MPLWEEVVEFGIRNIRCENIVRFRIHDTRSVVCCCSISIYVVPKHSFDGDSPIMVEVPIQSVFVLVRDRLDCFG